jgi:hypothetical protein
MRFQRVAGRNLLFSGTGQKLFEINDTAAYIWRSIEDGLDRGGMLDEMAERGLAPALAEQHLDAAIDEWTGLGFIKHVPEPTAGLPLRRDIRVAGVDTRLRLTPCLAADLVPAFRHLGTAGTTPEVTLDVVGGEGRIDLFRNGDPLLSCRPEEAATALKGQVMDEVLGRGDYALALHAAALSRDGRMLLLTGPPGAGKTTLALALAGSGFGLAGDDLVLLATQGRVTGVPFAAAVKAGAWRLIAPFRPDLMDAAVFRRPDGRRVRYLPPDGPLQAASLPVGWLVSLERRRGAEPALTPADPVEAMRWLLREAHAEGRRLTPAGFEALGRAIGRAACFRLSYRRLEDAVELLEGACR